MTDEADSSVVLAKLQVTLIRECNNQRLSPWSRPYSFFSRSCYRSLSKHLSWSPRQLEYVLLVYYQLQRTPPFAVMQSQLPHGGSVADLLLGAGCSLVLYCFHNPHSCTVLSNILSKSNWTIKITQADKKLGNGLRHVSVSVRLH